MANCDIIYSSYTMNDALTNKWSITDYTNFKWRKNEIKNRNWYAKLKESNEKIWKLIEII